MKPLRGQEAIDRIRWKLAQRGDVLGRVTFRDYDLMTLRYIVAVAERSMKESRGADVAAAVENASVEGGQHVG